MRSKQAMRGLGAMKQWIGGLGGYASRLPALALILLALGGEAAQAQGRAWAAADVVARQPGGVARMSEARVGVAWEPAARDNASTFSHQGARTEVDGANNGRSLLDSYSQGDKDNCGSVALTKLVLALYGPAPASGPVRHGVQGDGSTAMQLADGSMVWVTARELEQARLESGMEAGTGEVLDWANLMYAALAVRLAHARDGRGLDAAAFARALKTMGKGGDGADEDALAPLLGFAFDDRSPDNGAKEIYLLSSPLHVAFAFQGRYDEHGQQGGESTRNFRAAYREAGSALMFRDFLETWHGADGRPVLVRQCSQATAGWTPGTAKWIPRSACAM